MPFKSSIFSLLAVWLLLHSCTNGSTSDSDAFAKNDADIVNFINNNLTGNDKPAKQSNGLWYLNLTKPPVPDSAAIPTVGSQVNITYTGKLLNGTSFAENRSAAFAHSPSLIFYTPLELMKKGETALFLIPSYLTYGGNAVRLNGVDIPPYSVLYIEKLTLDSIRTENQVLSRYFEDKNLTPDVRPSGLYFARTSPAQTGDLIKSGQEVTVTYKGILPIDGTVFDPGTKPLTFTVGTGDAIRGFDEAIQLMRLNESALIGLPNSLAYGTQGSGTILPYTPLVFEATVTKLQ
jgi:FKBP-type peptidyl-prolyl cis-trans isomerase